MPIHLDYESAYAQYDFEYLDQGNLTIQTASFVAGVLKEGRHIWEILQMLSSSRITQEVLLNTDIIDAVSRLEHNAEFRVRVQKLLLRLLRISKGKTDALNEHAEDIFYYERRDYLTREEQDYYHTKTSMNCLLKRSFELMAEDEIRSSKKRKIVKYDERPSKYRRIEDGEDSNVRKAVSASKSPFVFPSDYVPIYDENTGRCREELVSSEIKFSPALKLAFQLTMLPMRPSGEDVGPLMWGLSVKVLQEAEEIVGRQMNRSDAVWWALLFRDYRRPTKKWNCGIREIYRRTVKAEEEDWSRFLDKYKKRM